MVSLTEGTSGRGAAREHTGSESTVRCGFFRPTTVPSARKMSWVPSGCHRAHVGTGTAQGPHRPRLVGTQAFLRRDGVLHPPGVDGRRRAGGQGAQVLEHGVLQRPVRHRGPLGRSAAIAGREAHDMLRRQEVAGHGGDLGRGPASGGLGGHVRVDVGLGEAGLGGAQAGLGIDEGGGDVRGVEGPVAGAVHQPRLQGDGAADAEFSGFGPPALDQQQTG